MKWLADENLPFPAFHLLKSSGFDVKHIGIENPSVEDPSIIKIASDQNRIILTFDSDFGELVFKYRLTPPGVIYFRLINYGLADPAVMLIRLLEEGYIFENYFTVISRDLIRQRSMVV